MSERLTFIQACLDRTERIVTICDRFGISEKTGHKWLQRFKETGAAGLADRSHAPQTHTHRITPDTAARLVALRRKYPLYGPQKLRDWLLQHEPHRHWPAASSIGELWKRVGLVQRRRRRDRGRERLALDSARAVPQTANATWTADFKGHFRLGDGQYCYPLTVLDLHSHYLLRCTALETTAVATTRRVFVSVFREYGLPEVLRTDNGVPFAQHNAIGRLGALAFWWVRLGIRPEHITPARPAENGAHERFHKTLKAGATRPAAQSLAAQQHRFDRFRREYNSERPHASLPSHVPPANVYMSSPRTYPVRLPTVLYPTAAEVRLVDVGGFIKWRNHPVFLSHNLAGQYVGLTATAADLTTIAYGSLALGEFDPHLNRFIPRVRWLG
jgi:putative transposase